MSVPAKRRSRSKTRVSRSHKKLTGKTLSTKTNSDNMLVPHRLSGYVSQVESTLREKRKQRSERRIKARAA